MAEALPTLLTVAVTAPVEPTFTLPKATGLGVIESEAVAPVFSKAPREAALVVPTPSGQASGAIPQMLARRDIHCWLKKSYLQRRR